MHTFVRLLSELGFPTGVSLDGQSAERSIAFRLAGGGPVAAALLHLRVRFSRAALPQSNLQVFANGVRIGVLLRSQADTSGTLTADLTLPPSSLGADFVSVSLRSAVAAVGDQCLDQRLALAFVTIEPQSYFSYETSLTSLSTVRQAWATMPDTISVALPARPLTGAELRAALDVAVAASGDGHAIRYLRLPSFGDVVIAKGSEVAVLPSVTAASAANRNLATLRYSDAAGQHVSILVDAEQGGDASALLSPQWSALTGQPAMGVGVARPVRATQANDVTLSDIGFTDLARSVGSEATWTIPLDVRDMPVGRVPSRVELQIVTAPNSVERQLALFAFYNGTLVQSVDIDQSGAPQLVSIRLPSAFLTTRNELRVTLQRHVPAAAACTSLDAPIPAQILPSSRVITTPVDAGAAIFTAVAARMSAKSRMYLPVEARDHPETYLPLIMQFGRAFWSAGRTPTPVFYANQAPAAPSAAFVVFGRLPNTELDGPVAVTSGRFVAHRKNSADTVLAISDLSRWSVAQVVHWGSQLGVQIFPGAGRPRLADWPAAYGGATLTLSDADSTIFRLNTADKQAELLFNDGPTIGQRIRQDLVLWILFFLLVVLPPVILAVRAVIRRTPRRTLSRGFDRSAPPAT